MSPAMLNIGPGKTQNYNNLAQLSGLLNGTDSSSLLNGGSSAANNVDSVSLTYNKIGDQIISDMAAVTAETIKQYPELDNDYVIVIVDDGNNREARVYSRKDILDNFEGTEAEKAALEKGLATNPLLVYNNAAGLPETKDSKAYKQLESNINDFLSKNKKTMDVLDKAGYDPLASLLGNSTIKKIIANCALPLEVDKKDENSKTVSGEDENQTGTDSEDE